MTRKDTKVINIGGRKIGGGNPVAIQSMTNTKTEDVEATVAQILALEKAGCEIIRCAVPTMEAAQALKEIKSRFISHWLQIYILIIVLRLLQLKTVQIKSVSIRGISEVRTESVRLWRKQKNTRFRSVSG